MRPYAIKYNPGYPEQVVWVDLDSVSAIEAFRHYSDGFIILLHCKFHNEPIKVQTSWVYLDNPELFYTDVYNPLVEEWKKND